MPIISLILAGCSNNSEKTISEYVGRITDLEKRMSILEEKNAKLSIIDDEKLDIKDLNGEDIYYGSVIQIGGVGSRFTQTTTYVTDKDDWAGGTYYLFQKDLINVSFNNFGDLMTVSCRDGYKMISCKSNRGNGVWAEEDVGFCRIEIEDKIQNHLDIGCKAIDIKKTKTDDSIEQVELYGKVKRISSSGDTRFYYYDIEKKEIVNNNGNDWFFATPTDIGGESIDNFFNYIKEDQESVFKITGFKEKEDCGYMDGFCFENIVINKIERIN